MRMSLKALMIAAVALCGGAAVEPTPAEAQVYYGVPVRDGGYLRYQAGPPAYGYRPDAVYRRGGASYGPRYGYRPAGAYYGPGYGWGGGYRGANWGPRYGGYYRYGGYPYGYYGRSYDNGGGAVAAGLIGGLALGAIANAATRPSYRRAYYPAYNNCFFERRRIVTRNGNAVFRRVRTCY
jgi:hypothetical protein